MTTTGFALVQKGLRDVMRRVQHIGKGMACDSCEWHTPLTRHVALARRRRPSRLQAVHLLDGVKRWYVDLLAIYDAGILNVAGRRADENGSAISVERIHAFELCQ